MNSKGDRETGSRWLSFSFSFFSLKFIREIISWSNQNAINCSSTTYVIQLKNLTVKYIQVLLLSTHDEYLIDILRKKPSERNPS